MYLSTKLLTKKSFKMKKTVNQRIRELRESLKMSQTEFALKINSSVSLIAKIDGGIEVKEKVILKICSTFNVNGIWLLEGKGEMFINGTLEENIRKIKISNIEKGNQSIVNPFENALYRELKEENNILRTQLEKLTQVLINVTGGPGVNSAQLGKQLGNLKSLLKPNPSSILRAA